MDVLIALGGGVLGLMGGYVFGVLRTLNERRNERRDVALAEIYKEMVLCYRSLVVWTDDPHPNPDKPNLESDTTVRRYANQQFPKFVRTFYGNAIWLGKGTHDLIEEFVVAGREALNELKDMRADGSLPSGTNPKRLREERLSPPFYKVQRALRDEVEASRDIIPFPYRIVVRKNGKVQRRTDPGEGE